MNQNDDELRKLKSIIADKERDLLLSASIGKELLEKNTKLEDKIVDLQSELKGASENLEQLSYQLNQKNDLINILTSDDECNSQNGKRVCIVIESSQTKHFLFFLTFSNSNGIEVN